MRLFDERVDNSFGLLVAVWVFEKFIQLPEHLFRLTVPERLPSTLAFHRGGPDGEKLPAHLMCSEGEPGARADGRGKRIEGSRMATDGLVDVLGRASVDAVLELSGGS